ncbi:EamA family transporter [Nocardioides caricicola]|uniref:DMT family transporter n=1 Tax=Nocardioides caricicola TaxID=634770 RepID=A0ABW0N5G3_9ACTN
MTTLAHDEAAPVATGSRLASGLTFAVLSAFTFGLSGSLASPMLQAGWSAGAIVLIRVGIAALVVLPLGLVALHGRWSAVRRNAGLILAFGAVAVAGAQFCYFSAVQHMQVGPAILIEYTAPAAVVVWMWLRHGQRPGPVTLVGAGLAALGLVLVLDLLSGADLSLPGVLWALAAMVGAATYFIVSADDDNGLPPMALAAGGLVAGAAVIAALGLLGLMPMRTSTASVEYAGQTVAWWVPLVLLGVVTAAIPYTTGIAGIRRLGSRLASFVALLEVVASVLFAWLLLDQLPMPVQLVGGVLILAGVVCVKLGERETATSEHPAV